MINVNGIEYELKSEMVLSELLVQLELSQQLCAIEVNQKLVPHKERDSHKIHDGDNVEIVSLVGGG